METCLSGLRHRIQDCCESLCSCVTKNPDKTDSAVVISNVHATGFEPDPPGSPGPRGSPASPPVPGKPTGTLYTALYDYQARTTEDLSFHAGDKVEILKKSDSGWWIARALDGVSAGRSGYIPANFVAPLESLDAQM